MSETKRVSAFLLVTAISGMLGWLADQYAGMYEPQLFWLLGMIAGTLNGVILSGLLRQTEQP